MMYFFLNMQKTTTIWKNNNNKFINITDESNIEVIGSPTTVSILTELLIPSVQESGDQVPEEFCEQAQNDESLTTTEATEKPSSSTVTTATTCMESSM